MKQTSFTCIILLSTTLNGMLTEQSNDQFTSTTNTIPPIVQDIANTSDQVQREQIITTFINQELNKRIKSRRQQTPQQPYIREGIPTYQSRWPTIACYEDDTTPNPQKPVFQNLKYVAGNGDTATVNLPRRYTLELTLHPKTVLLLPAITQSFITKLEQHWNQAADKNLDPGMRQRMHNWCLHKDTQDYAIQQKHNLASWRQLTCLTCFCIPCCLWPIDNAVESYIISNMGKNLAHEVHKTAAQYDTSDLYSIYALRYARTKEAQNDFTAKSELNRTSQPLDPVINEYIQHCPSNNTIQPQALWHDIDALYTQLTNVIPHTSTHKSIHHMAHMKIICKGIHPADRPNVRTNYQTLLY